MSKKKVSVIVLVAAVVVILLVAWRLYERPVPLANAVDFDSFVIDNVYVGVDEEEITDSSDTEGIADVLAQSDCMRSLLPTNRAFVRSEETIQINARDSKGAVHAVISAEEAFLYRDASHRMKLQNVNELYENIKGYCQ